MHDVSIKLLAVVEGPRELEDDDDDDDDPHYCHANNRMHDGSNGLKGQIC